MAKPICTGTPANAGSEFFEPHRSRYRYNFLRFVCNDFVMSLIDAFGPNSVPPMLSTINFDTSFT